jgi:hypothetical protein
MRSRAALSRCVLPLSSQSSQCVISCSTVNMEKSFSMGVRPMKLFEMVADRYCDERSCM